MEDPIEMPASEATKPMETLSPLKPTQPLSSSSLGPLEPLTKSEIALQKRCKSMEEAGVTRSKVYQTLHEGLTAVRVVETVTDMGEADLKEVPDYATRHKYMETALKVFGDLVEVKTEVNVDNSSKTLQISAGESEELTRLRAAVYGASK